MHTHHNTSADGLRGIASLNVAAAHFIAAFLPSALHYHYPSIFPYNPNPGTLERTLLFPPMALFFNGHFAVLIFFVLSGYVLSLPAYSRQESRLKQRLWARYLRLNIPIFVCSVLSYLCLQFGLYHNQAAAVLSGSSWFSGFFATSLSATDMIKLATYRSILSGSGDLLPQLWTLNLEFIGSIMLLAFLLCRPSRAWGVPMAMIAVAICLTAQGTSPYYLAILAGSVIPAIRISRSFLLLLFWFGSYLGCFSFQNIAYDFLPSIFDLDRKTLYNTIGAWCLTTAIVHGVGSKFLSSRPIQYLGAISYSLYLIHFLLLSSAAAWLYIALPKSSAALCIEFLAYLLGTLGVAHVLTKLVDAPAIQISQLFGRWIENNKPVP